MKELLAELEKKRDYWLKEVNSDNDIRSDSALGRSKGYEGAIDLIKEAMEGKDDMFVIKPKFADCEIPEPSLKEIVFTYYVTHFDQNMAEQITDRYFDMLSTIGETNG